MQIMKFSIDLALVIAIPKPDIGLISIIVILYTKYSSDANYSYSYSLHQVKFPIFHDATSSSSLYRIHIFCFK